MIELKKTVALRDKAYYVIATCTENIETVQLSKTGSG